MCKTKFCRNKGTGYCNTCISRRARKRNPMRYAYDTLKQNCKRRHGPGWFYLTFEEFKQFAVETKYLIGKGKTRTSYTIDKKDPTMGYFIGNIRVMQNGDNARKSNRSLSYIYVEEVGRMVAILSDNKRGVIYHSEAPVV